MQTQESIFVASYLRADQFIAGQRHSPRRIAKNPELNGLLPQFAPQFWTISMRTKRPGGASGSGQAAQHSEIAPTKDYQGIIRCRAGAGGQGKPRGDGKPKGPDRPLGKGVGGIKTNARSVRVWGSAPIQSSRRKTK